MKKGQLNLFTRRVRAAPPPLEFHTTVLVADYLRWHAKPDWRWSHFPSGEKRSVATGARLKRMGVQPGWPDFLLLSPAPGRLLHCLELKRRGKGRLSDEQVEFQRWCAEQGYPHYVSSSFNEVVSWLVLIGAAR